MKDKKSVSSVNYQWGKDKACSKSEPFKLCFNGSMIPNVWMIWRSLAGTKYISCSFTDGNLGELQVDMRSSFCFYNPWGLDLKTSHGSDLRMFCSFSAWFGGPFEMCNYLNSKKKEKRNVLYLHICQNDWIALQIDLIFKFLLTVIHNQIHP